MLGKTLKLKEIKTTEMCDNILNITSTKGNTVQIDLTEFEKSDIQKLKKDN